MLRLVCLITILILISCGGGAPKKQAPLTNISDPLARIPVRQDVIKDAVPENKVVQKQADETKADVSEAQKGVDEARIEKDKLVADLEKEKLDTNKAYRQRVNWMRIGCVTLIGVGIGLSFWADKRWFALVVAGVSMLIAIAVEAFVYKVAVPVFIGVCLLFCGMLIYDRYVKHKSNKELVATGSLLIDKLGDKWNEVKGEVKQSRYTKKVVNKFTEK